MVAARVRFLEHRGRWSRTESTTALLGSAGSRARLPTAHAGLRKLRTITGLASMVALAASTACQPAGAGASSEAATSAGLSAEATTGGETTGAGDVSTSGDNGDLEAELGLSKRSFPLLIWSAYAVSTDYVDASRFDARVQLEHAFEGLGMSVPEFTATLSGDVANVDVRGVSKELSLAGMKTIRDAADVLERALEHTQEVLTLDPEPLHELEYAAINGLLSPLDPHTILLTPEETSDLGVKTRGVFGGIGVEIVLTARRPLVTRVLPSAPAELAGIEGGDVVIAIDGRPTLDLGLEEVQGLMRGELGTKVVLTVKRAGKTLDVSITRATIRIPSVEALRLEGDVGLVRLTNFQEDSVESFAKALADFEAERPITGLVIDLRGNSGGLLQQATRILDLFVDEGELVIVHSRKGREQEVATRGKAVSDGIPIVALVNEDSASAAEIVAGSLQALGRGVVVGRTSFGKGSVQMLRDAAPYGRPLALKLTVAEYRVAGERRIQTRGVSPDLELVPVLLADLAGVAQYYDRERFDRRREWARVMHLPSALHENSSEVEGRAPRSLVYLDRPIERIVDPATKGRAPAPGLPGRIVWASDPEIELARQVAASLATATDRTAWPGVLDALRRDADAREQARLVEALVGSGIAWSAAPSTGPASLDVRLQVAQAEVTAGRPFTLRIDVTNTGAEPVERVHLMTDCPQGELDGVELLLGRIEPGATVTRSLDLQFLPWRRDMHERLRIDVHADDVAATPDAQADLILDVRAQSSPRYAFDWWVLDDPALAKRAPPRPKGPDGKVSAFEVRGNGNGVLEPGEHVYLSLRAFNEGPGTGVATRVVVDNTTAAQALLEEGLVEFGAMPTGASREATIAVAISEQASPSLPVELGIMVGDGFTRESTRTKLRLPVALDAPTFEASKGNARVVADRARLYAGASTAMPVVTEVPAGVFLEVLGSAGPWLGVRGPHGQRAFVDASLVEVGREGDALPKTTTHMVQLPSVEVSVPERRTTAASVELRGIARHPERVRDVVVHVAPSDPRVRPRKVAYVPNRANQGEGSAALEFAVEVPLELGSNRLVVQARDGDEVEAVEELWVFRDG